MMSLRPRTIRCQLFFVALSLALQCGLMVRLLGDPRKFAPWFNATGTLLYVLGMLVSGFAIGAHLGVPR